MRVAVINLPHRVDRREWFARCNAAQPLRFEFVPAADGRRLDRGRLAKAGLIARGESGFNAGALGNALSHAALWRACADGDEPYLILEDDSCLRGDFWRHAKGVMEKYLSAHHAITFGFNTDAVVALRGSDGVVSAIRFDETIKRRPGYFEEFARLHDARPSLFQCRQYWGTLAYAVSPEGARAMMAACLPLSSREPVEIVGEGRRIAPYGIDGMINLALQQGRLDIVACYPALALGPNSRATSDIQGMTG